MRGAAASRPIRAVIIPIGAIVGLFATPTLLMPSPDELRGAGQIVDGTGYGSAGILGLVVGALFGYIVRTVLDHTVWRSAQENDVHPAA